jgi:hypothetical protein
MKLEDEAILKIGPLEPRVDDAIAKSGPVCPEVPETDSVAYGDVVPIPTLPVV